MPHGTREAGLDDGPILPAHIEDTVRSIAQLQADHHRDSSSVQRAVSATVDLVGRPGFVGLLVLLVLLWIAGNIAAGALGRRAVDPPPFAWLESVVSLAALFMTVLILTTQRHEDRLAQLREQLTLELSILSEQKTAKIIALLETLRRDLPNVRNRVDEEAAEMSMPADPHAVLDAIKRSHGELSGEPGRELGGAPGGEPSGALGREPGADEGADAVLP